MNKILLERLEKLESAANPKTIEFQFVVVGKDKEIVRKSDPIKVTLGGNNGH